MYIIKNALRSISRAKGRNILIGIIAFAIAVSACIALSIRESAIKAREDTLSLMNITAQITRDRQAMFNAAGIADADGGEQPTLDREAMKEMLRGGEEMSLADYEKYAAAKSVKESYYTLSTTLNAGGDIEPIDTNGTFGLEAEGDSTQPQQAPTPDGGTLSDKKGGGKFKGMMGTQGDFTLVGYSGDNAMTDFVSGSCSVSEGAVFDTASSERECIISEELATYNSLTLGSVITLVNPNNSDEAFDFAVVGIYSGESAATDGFVGGFSTSTDSANKIMTSYTALKNVCDTSAEGAEEVTDEKTGMSSSTAVAGTLSYTYVFSDVEAYEAFAEQAAALGLSEDYTVTSSDVSEFENSLVPLENLSRTAMYFLVVVFIIGAVVLTVINIFNIRERKYEIGVLTAIGMKKQRVAAQLVTELFVVTLAAIAIGTGVGAACSVSVTNALLSAQITSNEKAQENVTSGFGRETDIGGGMMGMPDKPQADGSDKSADRGGFGGFMQNVRSDAQSYISEVSYSTDITVVLQLAGVGILLTLISSLAASLFIMRYEPLRILTDRD